MKELIKQIIETNKRITLLQEEIKELRKEIKNPTFTISKKDALKIINRNNFRYES